MSADLLRDVEKFLTASGMGPAYFGKKAVGNSRLVERLRNGRPTLSTTEDSVRAFMRANKPQDPGEPERATGT